MEIIRLGGETAGTDASTGGLRVTDLKSAVRNENRVNVFVDGKYEFSLDVAQIVDFNVKIGKELTVEELEELKRASEFGKLYQRALEWVLMRPRSEKEVKKYLKERILKRKLENLKRERNRERRQELRRIGDRAEIEKMQKFKMPLKQMPEIDEGMADLVFLRLMERGYIDDEKFTRYYVDNRMTKKGISKKRMRMELMEKGVKKEIFEEILASSERNDEEEIEKIIQKKWKKYNDFQKMLGYLVRQGFEYEKAKEVLSRNGIVLSEDVLE